MSVICHIYSVQEVFKIRDFMRNNGFSSEELFSILRLRDIGEMYIDRIKYIAGENYLSYPTPDNDYFQFNFAEWLERFVVCEGSEFWYFLNP